MTINQARDTIRALDPAIQLATTKAVGEEATRRLGAQRKAASDAAVAQIFADTPDLTVDQADKLIAWQEAREQRRGGNLPEPQ